MKSKNRYKILVAEDNKINIKVAEYILKPIASVLDFVINGEEVLKKIETTKYDVILMDIRMPVMDGYEATQRIRALEAKNNSEPIKIIAITANNQPEEAEYCKSVGMDDHIAKPFKTNEILDLIEN